MKKQEKKFKRQCIICGEIKNRNELIRITQDYKTGEVKLNINNKLEGRSVYICKEGECAQKALKLNKKKAVKKVKIDENIKQELYNLLQK